MNIVDDEWRIVNVSFYEQFKQIECKMTSLVEFKQDIMKAFSLKQDGKFIYHFLFKDNYTILVNE